MYTKVVLFGDNYGIPQTIKYFTKNKIIAIVCASIRPQYIDELQSISEKLNIPLLIQPKYNKHDYEEFKEKLSSLKPDLLICNSYSMIIREDVRKIFNDNCFNIHWSLLPKNRGPNPIQWCLIKGEKKTGVTIHHINDCIDTGDIVFQSEVIISEHDTWVDLKDKLDRTAEKLIESSIPLLLNSQFKKTKQDENVSTTNFRLDSEYPKIDFKKMSNKKIYNLIRAQTTPLKGAYIQRKNSNYYINKKISLSEIQSLREEYEQ